MRSRLLYNNSFGLALLLMLLSATGAFAQSSSFTYQGRLTDGGAPANGNYDLQFALFDSVSAGTQIGSTQTVSTVSVSGGIFTVTLDFGAGAFPGASRFLEMGARPAGSGSFTTLSPRQPITSTPYAVRSASAASADTATTAISATNATNSSQLGGVAATNYVQTNDARLSDARSPTPGSPNYIQNTTSEQAGSNFNISGNGTASGTLSGNIVNATTQYNIGGSRVLSVPGADNTFAGVNAGTAITLGFNNSFFGSAAGGAITTGLNNSFFGTAAGKSNTNGVRNSFFGTAAGGATTGGFNNSFFGNGAGGANTTGSNNTIIGFDADVGSNNLSFATAIGAGAVVSNSDSIVLGRSSGADAVRIPGPVIIDGTLVVHGSGSAGSNQVCRNSADRLSPCSSSLRYKTAVQPFAAGLNIVSRLRPISFTWKEGGMRDLGLGAEDVAKVEPLLVTHNSNGEIEGVRYDRLTAVLVNAIKEQQTRIETLQAANVALNTRLRAIERRLQRRAGATRHR